MVTDLHRLHSHIDLGLIPIPEALKFFHLLLKFAMGVPISQVVWEKSVREHCGLPSAGPSLRAGVVLVTFWNNFEVGKRTSVAQHWLTQSAQQEDHSLGKRKIQKEALEVA